MRTRRVAAVGIYVGCALLCAVAAAVRQNPMAAPSGVASPPTRKEPSLAVTSTLDGLMRGARDNELCAGVYHLLNRACDLHGVAPSREQECVIVLTWDAIGVIGNGGFSYLLEGAFFERDPGYTKTAGAFKLLGLDDIYRAFTGALAWFPESSPPQNAQARMSFLKQVPEDELQRANRLVWRSEDAYTKRLADYIRANRLSVERILSDYELPTHDSRQEKFTVDASWHITSRASEAMPELLLRLNALPPGSVLAVVIENAEEALPTSSAPGQQSMAPITTEDYLRQFCGAAGHVVIRADPPCYWIRRGGRGR